MDQAQALHDVEVAIQTHDPTIKGSYYLVALNGKVYLQPEKHKAESAEVICTLTAFDLRMGLEPSDWNGIRNTLRKLRKEGKL